MTSLLKFLLDTKRIDGAVLSSKEGLWNNKPMIATKFEHLLQCAGSSLGQSRSVRDLGDLTTYTRIFGALKGPDLSDLTKLAVVGTPCQILTIRKMQLLRIVPSHLVCFTIGLFCFENFLMVDEKRKYLEDKLGASLNLIEKINLKEDFIARLKDGRTVHVDLEDLDPIVRSPCLACTDFSNYAADISVGGLGSPDGYTTTVVRNRAAQRLINQAINHGYLEEIQQKGTIDRVERMAERKRERGKRVFTEREARRVSRHAPN